MSLHENVDRIMISQEQIAQRVKELAVQLDQVYQGRKPLMVCILKGSVVFFADLIREMDTSMEIDFMSVSSYGAGTTSSGKLKIKKDLSVDIEGRDVLIVEDIIDSGLTLKYIKTLFETRGAKSVRICSLLDKPSGRRTELVGDYIGFEIPGEFVVGYGLDYDERYRNLPDVCVLDPKVYS